MSKSEEAIVEEWVESALVKPIQKNRPISVHVDELFPAADSNRWIHLGYEAFKILLKATKNELEKFAVVCFPLGCTTELDVSTPNWNSIHGKPVTEPPSLYLVSIDSMLLPNLAEEYRCPILPPSELGQVLAYYRCFRTPDGIENNWEYERAIYIEGHPK